MQYQGEHVNDTLEKLLYESGLTAQGSMDNMDSYCKAAIENLVLRTVLECVNIIETAVDQREPASTYVNKIKSHFGV